MKWMRRGPAGLRTVSSDGVGGSAAPHGMPLQWLATRGGVLPNDPVLQIVMYMQAGVPAAQTTVAMLAAAGKTKMAGELSTLYLPQYLVSVFTMAAIIVIAINVIGEEPVPE